MTAPHASPGASIELQILVCAIALGIVQLLFSVSFNVAGRGLRLWHRSAR